MQFAELSPIFANFTIGQIEFPGNQIRFTCPRFVLQEHATVEHTIIENRNGRYKMHTADESSFRFFPSKATVLNLTRSVSSAISPFV